MKRLSLTCVLFFLCMHFASGDEPPSWREFEIWSSNLSYLAKVTVKQVSPSQHRGDWKWLLTVYEAKAGGPKQQWSCDYSYDGYEDGILSDDGTTFTYVSFWYYEDNPIVQIYQDGKLRKEFTGNDFEIDKDKIQWTASHQVWLSSSDPYRYISTGQIRFGLEIRTIDGQRFVINLETLELLD